MALSDITQFVLDNYEIYEWRHASAVMVKDFPQEWDDLMTVLTVFRLKKSYINVGGGNRSLVSASIDGGFFARGWRETEFDTRIVVDQNETHSPTHKVDNFKNKIAVEMEWNNKDPFFDRDLNNFRLLFELRVVSVGVIITRTDALQEIFNTLGRGGSYGEATTHMRKLLPKLEGGGGGGCPVLAFGIKPSLYLEDT